MADYYRPITAVLAQHYADSVQRLVLVIRRFGVVQCNIILAHDPTTITYILYTNRFTT